MANAIANELKRLGITRASVEEVNNLNSEPEVFDVIISGYRRARENDVRHEVEINNWLSRAPMTSYRDTPEKFWEDHGTNWALLRTLARAIFVAQASNASSERIWSEADNLSGGDRSSVAPEVLNCQLILKKNAAVRAKLCDTTLFGAM